MTGELQVLEKGQFVDMIDIDALHGPASVPMHPREWFILRTHPNCERKVMREFERRHISGYCPLISKEQRVVRSVRGSSWTYETKRMVMEPLFPQLVFVPDFETCDDRFHRIREVREVVGFLRFGDYYARVPSERRDPEISDDATSMADIRGLVMIANTPRSKRGKYEVDDVVSIVDGPFRGFAGRIERLDSKGRLKVAIQIFGRLSLANVSEAQIEPSRYPTDARMGREGRKPRRGGFGRR